MGLDWLPPSLGHIWKRLDLGKIMIDLAFFPNTLVQQKVLVSGNWRWWLGAGHYSLLIRMAWHLRLSNQLAYVGCGGRHTMLQ